MAFGDALQKRIEELAKRQPTIQKRLAEIAEGATLRAVEEAERLTPPNTYADGEINGTHTITGEMAQHWRADSQMTAKRDGWSFATTLENRAQKEDDDDDGPDNDKGYASYVNDGHKVDKHFVPGLYVDENGVLTYDPAADVGLVVGTKTKRVKGLHMKEAAIEKYKEVAETELQKLEKEMFQ